MEREGGRTKREDKKGFREIEKWMKEKRERGLRLPRLYQKTKRTRESENKGKEIYLPSAHANVFLTQTYLCFDKHMFAWVSDYVCIHTCMYAYAYIWASVKGKGK